MQNILNITEYKIYNNTKYIVFQYIVKYGNTIYNVIRNILYYIIICITKYKVIQTNNVIHNILYYIISTSGKDKGEE